MNIPSGICLALLLLTAFLPVCVSAEPAPAADSANRPYRDCIDALSSESPGTVLRAAQDLIRLDDRRCLPALVLALYRNRMPVDGSDEATARQFLQIWLTHALTHFTGIKPESTGKFQLLPPPAGWQSNAPAPDVKILTPEDIVRFLEQVAGWAQANMAGTPEAITLQTFCRTEQ